MGDSVMLKSKIDEINHLLVEDQLIYGLYLTVTKNGGTHPWRKIFVYGATLRVRYGDKW